MKLLSNIAVKTTVALVAVVFVAVSCKGKLKTTQAKDISQVPFQTVVDMFVTQTDKGNMQMRSEAPLMERYQNDTASWEVFPKGFVTYAFTETGALETEIRADKAFHIKPKKGQEKWEAYGNVSVKNLIKKETMETDTLYWDRDNERIYTDCYVSLLSPDGFMQGYGMVSDQRGRDSEILRPFNSYGLLDRDSTAVDIDSVNFIGPFPEK